MTTKKGRPVSDATKSRIEKGILAGLSYEEIAEMVNCSVAAVKRALSPALKEFTPIDIELMTSGLYLLSALRKGDLLEDPAVGPFSREYTHVKGCSQAQVDALYMRLKTTGLDVD
jgi:hypothetical protein